MSSTWISMPVENAKEVVQRQIQALSGTLTNYTSSTVTYEADCEVYFDTNYLTNLFSYNQDYVYFGYWYFATDTVIPESTMRINMDDNQATTDVFDSSIYPVSQSHAPFVWNNVVAAPITPVSFIGYKFKLV